MIDVYNDSGCTANDTSMPATLSSIDNGQLSSSVTIYPVVFNMNSMILLLKFTNVQIGW